jgi:hypothetical protein
MSRKNNRTNNIAANLSVPYETVRAAPERIHEVFPFLSCIVLKLWAVSGLPFRSTVSASSGEGFMRGSLE